MNRGKIREFPGAAKRLWSFSSFDGVLIAIALLLSVLLIFAFIRENRNELFPHLNIFFHGADVLNLKIIDTSPASTLLLGVITLLFGRAQFLHSALPYFDYRIYKIKGKVSVQSGSDGSADAQDIYVVDLTNVGKGLGVVTSASYWLEFKSSGDSPAKLFPAWFQERASTYNYSSRFRYSYHDFVDILSKQSMYEFVDWDAIHLGGRAAISPGETRRILVMTRALGEKLAAFDALITFESVLGDRFMREIYMIPRRQFPTSPPPVAPIENSIPLDSPENPPVTSCPD